MPEAIRQGLALCASLSWIGPGARIAITAGSRGIHHVDQITRILVQEVKASGAEPFVVASMGKPPTPELRLRW